MNRQRPVGRPWGISAAALLFFLSWALGCGSAAQDASPGAALPPPTGLFDHPEGIAVWGEAIAVANAAFRSADGEYAQGSVTLLDASSGALLAKGATTERNPQIVQVFDDALWVVCTGTLRLDPDTGVHQATTAGAVERWSRAALERGGPPDAVVRVDPPPGGIGAAPGSLAIDPLRRRAFLGSSLAAHVYVVDLDSMTLLRGPSNPIVLREHDGNDTVAVAWHPDGTVLAASFDTNALYRIDPETLDIVGTPVDLGRSGDLEGPLDLEVFPGASPDVAALMSVSNSVAAWDSATGHVEPSVATTGVSANELVRDGDVLYVVNSGDNTVTRFRWGTWDEAGPPVALPLASNPWAMAVHGGRAWVSLFLADGVAIVDLARGEVREVIR